MTIDSIRKRLRSSRLVRKVISAVDAISADPYEPARHFMRGPGPRSREKAKSSAAQSRVSDGNDGATTKPTPGDPSRAAGRGGKRRRP